MMLKNRTQFFLIFAFTLVGLHSSESFDKQAFIQSIKSSRSKAKDHWHKRVLLTLSCDDCEYIPKVPNAGKIFKKNDISYQLMHNGVKIIANCYYCNKKTSWMSDIIYGLRGHHEPQEEKVFHEVIKFIPDGGVMLELGSYWAYYSLWFASTVKNAKNYLVEPTKSNLAIGERNFELNNKSGFFFQGYAGMSSPLFKGIKKINIDDFLEEHGIEHLNILHSDIQGGEFAMLQDCQRSINQNKIDYFFISTHSAKIHADCLNFLKKNNFVIVTEHTPAESYSYDGLIVGRQKNAKGPDKVHVSKNPTPIRRR